MSFWFKNLCLTRGLKLFGCLSLSVNDNPWGEVYRDVRRDDCMGCLIRGKGRERYRKIDQNTRGAFCL